MLEGFFMILRCLIKVAFWYLTMYFRALNTNEATYLFT